MIMKHLFLITQACTMSVRSISFLTSSMRPKSYIPTFTTSLTCINMEISKFLAHVKEFKYDVTDNQIFLCVGNEAADADSIISSLCYSYLRQSKRDKSKDNFVPELYIPVVSIERSEISLRQDVNVLLQTIGMSINDLICIDEIPSIYMKSCKLKFILLDHNVISNKLMSYFSEPLNKEICDVEEILDHHIDVGGHIQCSGLSRTIAFDSVTGIPQVGSTCTLVAEKYFSGNTEFLDESIATLLMGVIALDTINMNPIASKGTSRDQQALNSLDNLLKQYNSSINRNDLFNQLKDAKMDPVFWTQLSAFDALRLDYKEFKVETNEKDSDSINKNNNSNDNDNDTNKYIQFGISAIIMPIEQFVMTSDLEESLNKYLCRDPFPLDLFVVISFIPSSENPRKQICLYSKNAILLERIILYLQKESFQLMLNKSIYSGEHNPIEQEDLVIMTETINRMKKKNVYMAVFEQGNLKISRKQLAPILCDFFSH